MATPSIQVDPPTARERVLEVIRGLLEELGSQGALPALGPHANLDRDLGLGSLERVELMSRLENAFGVRLPDRVITEANTPEDIARALLAAPGQGALEESFSGVRAAMRAQALHQAAQDRGVETAETLIDVLRFRARQDAARTHLTISEDDGRTATLTFGELYDAAQRVAAELARRGVPAGGTVALMLPTSREFFVTFAGTLLAGATPVPIYPPFRADRIEEYAARQSAILNNAEVCLLITFRKAEAVARLLKPQVRPLKAVVDALKLIEAADSTTPPAPGALPAHLSGSRARKGSDIALLQYTSGSTGNPKGVVLTHENLLANVRAVGKVVDIRPDDVGVSWLPLYHDMGLIGAWFTPLYYGLQLAVMSPLAFLTRPERWLWAFHRHRGTLTAAPNFAYELCVRKVADRDISGLDLSTWRAALNGAEPVNADTLERFAARFAGYGFRREALTPVYGLAEAALAVTVPPLGRGVRVDRVEREVFTREGRAVPARADDTTAISFVSSGPPIPGHEVKIVDGRGREVPDRIEGFLWFRGPSATSGYYRNEKATVELFPAGKEAADGGYPWLDSGDRAYRAQGEIYVTGRVKDIIIKAGRNIYPHEVEELAARAEGVRKGCVVAFGLPDEAAGTERLAVVAESRETDAARRSAIARAITEQVTAALGLPPDLVEIIPPGNIPKTSSGKLRREETKRVYLEGQLSTPKPPTWVQIARLGTASALRSAWSGLCTGLRQVLERLYGVYAAIAFGVWIVPAWTLVKLMPNPRAACRYTSAALKVYMAMVGCRIRVVGREHMAGGAKIYASNHTSYFDVLALMAALGVDYRFVAKMEVHAMPFIGTFMRRMNHYAFDRNDSQARLRQAEEMEETLRRGESVFVFPEGTFTPETGVRPFQLGAFKAAVDTGACIVPVSLRGTRRFLRDGTYLPRPTSVTITLSPPIFPPRVGGAGSDISSDWHALIQLRDATREAIGHHCGEPVL
jgi:1-acyl-sn-glycerol-3-phosphate acyltransferase